VQGETSRVINPQVARRSGKASHRLDRWYRLTMEEMQELFLYRDSDQLVDPTTYEETIYDINSLK